LTAGHPEALAGSVWADLYAGTGAVGIEALSRFAGHVCFVDSSRAAANLIRRNLATLNITTGFDLFHSDVRLALQTLQAKGIRFDYVFLDPPYRLQEQYAQTLKRLADAHLVQESGVVIAEHSRKVELADTVGSLRRYRKLVQADAALSFYSAKN
jgi:16S rRNA (guanine(966)-N(2))-methyltransferase RsmD